MFKGLVFRIEETIQGEDRKRTIDAILRAEGQVSRSSRKEMAVVVVDDADAANREVERGEALGVWLARVLQHVPTQVAPLTLDWVRSHSPLAGLALYGKRVFIGPELPAGAPALVRALGADCAVSAREADLAVARRVCLAQAQSTVRVEWFVRTYEHGGGPPTAADLLPPLHRLRLHVTSEAAPHLLRLATRAEWDRRVSAAGGRLRWHPEVPSASAVYVSSHSRDEGAPEPTSSTVSCAWLAAVLQLSSTGTSLSPFQVEMDAKATATDLAFEDESCEEAATGVGLEEPEDAGDEYHSFASTSNPNKPLEGVRIRVEDEVDDKPGWENQLREAGAILLPSSTDSSSSSSSHVSASSSSPYYVVCAHGGMARNGFGRGESNAVSVHWVQACREEARRLSPDLSAAFRPLPWPLPLAHRPSSPLDVTSTGYSDDERLGLQVLVEAMGLRYAHDYSRLATRALVCRRPWPDRRKYLAAAKHGRAVSERWLMDSVRAGALLPLQPYLWEPSSPREPVRRSAASTPSPMAGEDCNPVQADARLLQLRSGLIQRIADRPLDSREDEPDPLCPRSEFSQTVVEQTSLLFHSPPSPKRPRLLRSLSSLSKDFTSENSTTPLEKESEKERRVKKNLAVDEEDEKKNTKSNTHKPPPMVQPDSRRQNVEKSVQDDKEKEDEEEETLFEEEEIEGEEERASWMVIQNLDRMREEARLLDDSGSRRRRRGDPDVLRVQFSGLRPEDRRSASRFVQLLRCKETGGHGFDAQAQVVVAVAPRRTEKFLGAAVCGRPLVRFAWVEQSLRAGLRLPVARFLWTESETSADSERKDVAAVLSWAKALAAARAKAYRLGRSLPLGIFDGWRVLLLHPDAPRAATVPGLLRAGGAIVLEPKACAADQALPHLALADREALPGALAELRSIGLLDVPLADLDLVHSVISEFPSSSLPLSVPLPPPDPSFIRCFRKLFLNSSLSSSSLLS